MKTIFKFIFLLTCFLNFNSSSFSQDQSALFNDVQKNRPSRLVNPLYELRAGNFDVFDNSGTDFNTVTFDFLIYHTNLPDSGPFEFASGQYFLSFNPLLANGGTLTYEIIPGSTEFTNPDAVPLNPSVTGNELRLFRNVTLGPGNGPIVSPVYPGTRIVKVRLTTTAPGFDFNYFSFSWVDSTATNSATSIFGYIDSVSTNLTEDGTYIIDSSKLILPVELSSFTADVNKNSAVLNWSTSSERNNSGFDIERSEINGQWSKIGFVHGKGNSSSMNYYLFADRNLNSGKYKYRLKQIDYNGNYEYYDLQYEITIGIPEEFSLKQNYPNPFNPMTKIDFSLPEDGNVSLSVYDNSGKLVSKLLNRSFSSGYHSVNFNASDISSGIYFYKLEFNNNGRSFSKVMKMAVLK